MGVYWANFASHRHVAATNFEAEGEGVSLGGNAAQINRERRCRWSCDCGLELPTGYASSLA
jgi:hypothetical protein